MLSIDKIIEVEVMLLQGSICARGERNIFIVAGNVLCKIALTDI